MVLSYELRSLRGGQKSRDQRQTMSRDVLADTPGNRMLQMRVRSLVDALQSYPQHTVGALQQAVLTSAGKNPH